MTDYDQLERLAREATPGPWHGLVYGQQADVRATRDGGSTWVAECRTKDDAAYIAACSPDQVLRLVAIARAAEKAERVLQQAAVDASCQGVLMEWAGLMEERAAALREALSPEKERTE